MIMSNKPTEAIILAGGKGTRLQSITGDRLPKSLASIKGKGILEWEFDWLAREGIKHVILALGHHHEVILARFGDKYKSSFGVLDISISVEDKKLGSGGAVKLASQQTSTDKVLIMNGDILTNTSIANLIDVHNRSESLASMLLVNMTSPYGIAKIDGDYIVDFLEKPRLDIPIHAGVDIIESEIFNRFPKVGQMEDTIFRDLAKEKKFTYHLISNEDFWMSVDTAKDFEIANNKWLGL
jgi:NDP-sugar pyrophosphorylase family protein